MRTDRTTESYLRQPTVPVHNPFDDPRLEKRSIVTVASYAKEDQPLDFTVRKKLQNNDAPPTYIPGNERFSAQSILGLNQSTLQSLSVVDNNLHQPVQISNQKSIDPFFKPTALVAIVKPQPNNNVPILQHSFPAGRGFAGESSVLRHSEYQTHNSAGYEVDTSGDLALARVKESDESYSLQIEHKREHKREHHKQHNRERYHNDPEYAERKKKRNRERKRELRKDPAYVERERQRMRELRKDPAYVERERQRLRELRKDPAYLEQERKRRRELQRQRQSQECNISSQSIQKSYNSMNRFNLDPNFVSGFSYLQEFQESPLLLLAEASFLQLNGPGHSAQTHTSSHCDI
ncbi:hypothetical protein [Endozoicomonas sp. YOMI1]|uniref:hypothetical protein n=1 Tax=Endozoicomonas sp. YOMI1 TaxID=2828739 RepID=UPI002148C78D|nr:hypothetical protein [Endozoicomonas sp. YOMI1]